MIFSFNVHSDDVVILGTHWRTNFSGDDKAIMRGDICKAVTTAQKLGHRVHLMAPSLDCNGKKIVGMCNGGKECTKANMAKNLKSIAAKIPAGQKSNLLIQTVGHGGRGPTPSKNDLLINDKENLSADELAKMINDSGVTNKVQHVRALFFQCYSGGFNTIASKIQPAGKLCGVSHSTHTYTANVSVKELEKLNGSAFITGLWNETARSKGQGSLQDGMLESSKVLLDANQYSHTNDGWRMTTEFRAMEILKKGEFKDNSSSSNGVIIPATEIGSGFDFTDLAGGSTVSDKVRVDIEQAMKNLKEFEAHVLEVKEYNDSFTSYFTEDKKITERVKPVNCAPPKVYVNREINDLTSAVKDIEAQSLYKNEPHLVRMIQDMKGLSLSSLEKMKRNENQFKIEYQRFIKKLNGLLTESENLNRKMHPEDRVLTWNEKRPLLERYKEIEKELNDLRDATKFPAMREMAKVQKDASKATEMLKLMGSKKLSLDDKRALAATYNCENGPLFLGGAK